jgi:hypothetical protein
MTVGCRPARGTSSERDPARRVEPLDRPRSLPGRRCGRCRSPRQSCPPTRPCWRTCTRWVSRGSSCRPRRRSGRRDRRRGRGCRCGIRSLLPSQACLPACNAVREERWPSTPCRRRDAGPVAGIDHRRKDGRSFGGSDTRHAQCPGHDEVRCGNSGRILRERYVEPGPRSNPRSIRSPSRSAVLCPVPRRDASRSLWRTTRRAVPRSRARLFCCRFCALLLNTRFELAVVVGLALLQGQGDMRVIECDVNSLALWRPTHSQGLHVEGHLEEARSGAVEALHSSHLTQPLLRRRKARSTGDGSSNTSTWSAVRPSTHLYPVAVLRCDD